MAQQVDTVQNDLIHYGVLGMKWGVRRGREIKKRTKQPNETGEKQKLSKTQKNAIGIGVVTLAAAGIAYASNKTAVDTFVKKIFSSRKTISEITPKQTAAAREFIISNASRYGRSVRQVENSILKSATEELVYYQNALKSAPDLKNAQRYRANIVEIQSEIAGLRQRLG